MGAPTGLKIVGIHNARRGATNTDDEWILIDNDGSETWAIHGWRVTDETDRQIEPHIYVFPDKLATAAGWTFDPGESIYVFTGQGSDRFISSPGPGKRPQFHLYWGRRAMVWNNSGDRVYLRSAEGRFVTAPFPVP